MKCHAHTEALVAKPKGGVGFLVLLMENLSDYNDNQLGSSPSTIAPATLGSLAGHWSHVQLWINHLSAFFTGS